MTSIILAAKGEKHRMTNILLTLIALELLPEALLTMCELIYTMKDKKNAPDELIRHVGYSDAECGRDK